MVLTLWCMAALLPLLMPVSGASLGGVTIPFRVVALPDIWAHRCLVPFAAQPQVICSIALRNVLPSKTFGWSGAVDVPFQARLSLSGFDTHGSSTPSLPITLQFSFALMWLLLGRPVNAPSLFESQSSVFLTQLPSVLSMLPPFSRAHSTCCGWCFQPFFPTSGLPQRSCCGLCFQPFFPASGLPQLAVGVFLN